MIRNIIFDLGNVIIDLDLDRSELELKKIFGKNLGEKLQRAGIQDIFLDYEKGLVSEELFLDKLQSIDQNAISRRRIIDAWNAMLLGTPHRRLHLLKKLKENYRVFLLSNTNATHLDWVYDDLRKTYNISNFEEQFFHKAYYSHLINRRKPDADIFEFVLNDALITPQETLFIDDNADNIATASKLGIKSVQHRIGDEVCALMDSYLINSAR
jgi:putative hydrolase of the HAD superfamily